MPPKHPKVSRSWQVVAIDSDHTTGAAALFSGGRWRSEVLQLETWWNQQIWPCRKQHFTRFHVSLRFFQLWRKSRASQRVLCAWAGWHEAFYDNFATSASLRPRPIQTLKVCQVHPASPFGASNLQVCCHIYGLSLATSKALQRPASLEALHYWAAKAAAKNWRRPKRMAISDW